jgi:hypothetical protein
MVMHSTRRARRQAEPPPTGWIMPTVITFSIVAVMVAGSVTYSMFDGDDPRAGSTLPSAGTTTSVPSTGPTSLSPADLIDNARQIKPLEDIVRDDRVIYRGAVCRWRQWNKDISSSTIKCPGRAQFKVATARLTPVELRR